MASTDRRAADVGEDLDREGKLLTRRVPLESERQAVLERVDGSGRLGPDADVVEELVGLVADFDAGEEGGADRAVGPGHRKVRVCEPFSLL